jgi:hypothetical protein
MTPKEFSELASGVQSIGTMIALVVGAYWTYIRFVRQREAFPHIQFSVDIEVVGKHGDFWIIELVAYVENKGKVQHRFDDLDFDVNALSQGDGIESKEEYGGQTYFPHELTRGSWLPAKYRYFFVEPGIRAKYSYITHVHQSARLLMLHGWFSYPKADIGHTAERTIALRGPTNDGDRGADSICATT